MIHPHLSHLTTDRSWKDLTPDKQTIKKVEQIKSWLKQSASVKPVPVLKKKIKQGFKTLFFGPPGTGKTMAAALIGKESNMDVYKIDLSMVISKYIGETEKNLARIFDEAEMKNWILFFDEADALFGKRSDVKDAHDRFANQEIGYLLQRIEEYPGLVILASNLKSNIDKAFLRRFQSVIHFPFQKP